jgi:hypothetical protein
VERGLRPRHGDHRDALPRSRTWPATSRACRSRTRPAAISSIRAARTNLLCSVLRARTGVGADLPRRELFAPLGLSSAVWEPDTSGTPVCSSYLWATPRDWAAIGQFALQGGQWGWPALLPGGLDDPLDHRPALGQGEETGYAAGWWANRLADGTLVRPSLPADAYWASGHDGQRSTSCRRPARRRAARVQPDDQDPPGSAGLLAGRRRRRSILIV